MSEPGRVFVGTAGWAVPAAASAAFPHGGSSLERYAAIFGAAEINSTFHRQHRAATYRRWRDTVPDDFRFAIKLPKAITHKQRLADCDALVCGFAEEIAPLGHCRGPTLVQLPPSLAFDTDVAGRFFDVLAQALPGETVCEPRHPSWLEPAAEALLAERRVARVAADPAIGGTGRYPGGWPGLAYFRLHGTPRPYWSDYDQETLARFASEACAARDAGATCWVIFDNTAGGAAAGNALAFSAMMDRAMPSAPQAGGSASTDNGRKAL
jgi:uncharacterized protein YecE (DUF72 family)